MDCSHQKSHHFNLGMKYTELNLFDIDNVSINFVRKTKK
jgi:hypothetical protein